jgi:MFS family permease
MNHKFPRIFYGWWIVAACFLSWMLIGGTVILGFTAFFEPIANDLGWSYTLISLAASLRGLNSGILSPFAGFLFDRWGPRKIMFAGAVITCLGLIVLSYVSSLGMFYLGFLLVAIGMTGSSPAVAMPTLVNWFRKKLGLATGIAGCGFAFGGLLIPVIVQLIDTYGWRTAFFILGIATLVLGIPLSLVFRRSPEQYGYQPDGMRNAVIPPPGESGISAKTPRENTGAIQALKSRAFWHITLSMICIYLATVAVSVHIIPYLTSVGLSRTSASIVATILPLISTTGRLGSGWLSDRFNRKWVTIGFFSAMLLGILPMLYLSSTVMWLLVPFVLLFGFAWGGQNTLRVTMMNEYYGRSNFGSIFGLMMGIITVGGLAGPVMAGWVYDNLASYQVAWIILAVLVFLGILIIATIPRPTAQHAA